MFLRKGSRNLVYGLMFLFVSMNQQLYPAFLEFQNARWSMPQTIPLYDLESNPPILIADQNRTVHAFSSQWRGGIRVIVYNRWVYERGWTSPTDIIIFPDGEARITDAHLDKNGMLHIVFFGGNNIGADIYYSKAPAESADDANAWSVPFLIGSNAGDPEGAVFAEDDQGTLSVIYNGRTFGNSIYVVQSGDGGENWTDPTPIFFTRADEPNISHLQVIKGESGTLHAIWGVFNIAGQGRGIYYAQSKDGIEWSEPVLLADTQEGLGTQKPRIIEYNHTLLLVYNLSLRIMMRRSSDDGLTWDDPTLCFPRHVGVNGDMSLVIDSNNDLHLFFGQRISGLNGGPDIHGMWHSTFVNNRWSEPEAIIKGPLILDQVGNKGFDPNFARAVVSQGNLILVTWRTDPRSKGNGVWYSYKKFNAPELPVVGLPTSVDLIGNPAIADDSTPKATQIVSTPVIAPLETKATYQMPTDKPVFQNRPALPIIVGSISAIAFILIVAIASGLNRIK